MFSCSGEPSPGSHQEQYPTEYFQQLPQEEFYGTQFQPPPPPPPPLLHYPCSHPPPPPPPPPLFPHDQQQQQQQQQHSGVMGYCQQQQQPGYDFSYCEAQWMTFYDGAQHCGQYEAYCFREAYRFSSIQPSDCPPPTALPTPTPPLTRHQHQLQIQQQRGGATSKPLGHTNPTTCVTPPGGSLLNSLGPKPSQSESKMPGRHPHPPSGNNSKLKHKCPFDGCPWRFATPYKLRRHIKSHTKETPFVCKECGRGFSVRYNLLMHIQTIHSQPQKFKCPMPGCKEAFHTQPRLNGHLRRVHKKDWKTMQLPKPEVEGKQSGTGGGSRSSSTSSDDSVDTAPKTQRFECGQCRSVFSSQAKLTTHLESHSSEKSLKCTIQGCNKVFPTKEKLAKHLEIHKQQPKQFCCPHENCNRVFLRQSHLKNHLKIHAHNYFVCPVMDCNEKFASETDYNVHLNTHMNYRHKCHVAGCGHAFLTRKRLELHSRVMHGVELHGHQPLLPVPIGHGAPLIPPHSQHQPHSPPNLLAPAATHPLTHGGGGGSFLEDGIREVDLPGLSPDEIETILSENSHRTSGEQFKNFFHSAVELSELEAKLFSGSGYESDSGYSTYDVSPITSSAPLQFGGCRPEVSTSYRSISPALTPVNPSPYISLSSSNPFQFGGSAGGHSSMHLSLHSTSNGNGAGAHTPTTPLPHSAASPDADFAFFPPTTPSYHHQHHHHRHHHQSLATAPAIISPTRESYMVPGNGFPMAPTTPQQHQREFQIPPFAGPAGPVLPDLRPQQQHESYGIDFPDILDETSPSKVPPGQCSSGGDASRNQHTLPLSLLPPQETTLRNEIKMELEQTSCSNSGETGNVSPCSLSTAGPHAASPTTPFPGASSVKLETLPEGSNGTASPSCKMSSHQPPLAASHSSPNQQHAVGSRATASSDTHIQSFLATCSNLPSLQELVISGLHPSVVVVAVSTALAATLTDQPQQTHEMKVKEGPYDILRLHSLVSSLTPQQLEKLAAPELVSTSRRLATQHLEELAAARMKLKEKQANSTSATPKPKFQHKSTGHGVVIQSKTSVKTSITVKTYSKNKLGGGVSRVGAGSNMKSGHKKKTQWPRSMNRANLMAFREHILSKLKRGQEEGQRSMSVSQKSSASHASSGVTSPVFDMDMASGGADTELPTQVRCCSEPANFFSHQMNGGGELSPSPLNSSQSAGDISLKHFDAAAIYSSSEGMHPDLNPDILLSSSVLGLPDSILGDMEIDSLASMSSPSEHDFVQFLCDPSPPTSVTSPLDNMQDLDSIQDLLSVASENHTHFGEATTTSSSPSSTSPTTAVHTPFFSPSPSPTSTSALQQVDPSPFVTTPSSSSSSSSSQLATVAAAGSGSPTCSMADVASLFNESINSIANVESVPPQPRTTMAAVTLEDNLESVFQRSTDPLLACGSRYTLVDTSRPF